MLLFFTSPLVTHLFRYHIFLQLKKDILEGRLVPPLKNAAILASYAAQCEYQTGLETVFVLVVLLGSFLYILIFLSSGLERYSILACTQKPAVSQFRLLLCKSRKKAVKN